MSNESKMVWDPLKEALDKVGWGYDRIENRVGVGMPDTNICVNHLADFTHTQDVWAELKYAIFPLQSLGKGQTVLLKVGLEPAQYIWLRHAKRIGRRCILIARIKPSFLLGQHPEWRVWTEEKDWELAKHPAPLHLMLANSQGFRTPDALLLWLSGWLRSR